MRKTSLLCALLLAAASAGAIELTLEENRAERGAVGYVDMQRLFAQSPDARRAKESFSELVRQAEERVNLRKAEILKSRQELAALQARRDAAAAGGTATAGTDASAAKTRPLALPGMSNTERVAPPGSAAVSTPTVAASSATASAPAAVAVSSGAASAQQLLALDERILALKGVISRQETELTREHDESDHGLVDIEGRKTDQVLARLYRTIRDVAHEEGVSVVVDKSTILYGHQASDLTDKVLKRLSEAPQP